MLLSPLIFAGLASSLAVPNSDQKLQWSPCSYVSKPTKVLTQCANFTVPLDYTDPNSPPLTLQLIKVAALKGASKGTLFLNFGGPGLAGLTDIANSGLYQQA